MGGHFFVENLKICLTYYFTSRWILPSFHWNVFDLFLSFIWSDNKCLKKSPKLRYHCWRKIMDGIQFDVMKYYGFSCAIMDDNTPVDNRKIRVLSILMTPVIQWTHTYTSILLIYVLYICVCVFSCPRIIKQKLKAFEIRPVSFVDKKTTCRGE